MPPLRLNVPVVLLLNIVDCAAEGVKLTALAKVKVEEL